MPPTVIEEIPPAFSARLKARNPVLAAADSDGHLFRIFHERRRRLGWRRWLGSGRLFSTRTLAFVILVPVAFLLIAYLSCIGMALVAGLVVLVKQQMAFQKVAGPFPHSVSEIYAEHGCHAAVALDLWMTAVPAREAMEAIYAERFRSARLSSLFGWCLLLSLLVAIAVSMHRVSTMAGTVFTMGALAVMFEASLMLYLVPCQVGRKAIKARNDLWLGQASAFRAGLRVLGIVFLIVVTIAVVISASSLLMDATVAIAHSQKVGAVLFWVLIIAVMWAIIHLIRRRAAAREPGLLEKELGRSKYAHRALMTKLGLIE